MSIFARLRSVFSAVSRRQLFLGLTICAITLIAACGLYLIYDVVETRRLDAISVTLSENLTVPYGTPAKVSDFLAELQGELIDDHAISTDELGEIAVDFEYLNARQRQRPAHFTINVIDVTPPLLYGRQTFTLYRGYDGELTDLLISADDLDDHPRREILGDYDLDRVGTYSVEYRATDASGNVATQPLTLHVIEPPATSASSTPAAATSDDRDRLPLSEIIQDYKTKQTKIGIDVSRWQGKIDWPAVKAAGVEFAIIRLGYQTEFGGEYQLDKFAQANLAGARKAGLPIGVYFYSYATTPDAARDQAAWIIDQVGETELELGIFFDWENWSEFNQAGLSLRSLRAVADAFITAVDSAGFKGSLYGSKTYLETFWQPTSHPVWLAQYYDRVTYASDYWLWQISDRGRVPGISSDVDLDIMYLKE